MDEKDRGGRFATYLPEVVVLHTMYTYLDEQDADAIVP